MLGKCTQTCILVVEVGCDTVASQMDLCSSVKTLYAYFSFSLFCKLQSSISALKRHCRSIACKLFLVIHRAIQGVSKRALQLWKLACIYSGDFVHVQCTRQILRGIVMVPCDFYR
jgi:hypothetical protein